MAGGSPTPEVLLAVGVAVVVVILSLIFLARARGKDKDADLLDQLRSARVEIRDLLDTINCGTSLRPYGLHDGQSTGAVVLCYSHCSVHCYKLCQAAVSGGFARWRARLLLLSASNECMRDLLRTYG